jgi:hypothetical protein
MEGSSAELSLRAARWIKADTFAEDLLAAIADEERGGEIGEWARTIREKPAPIWSPGSPGRRCGCVAKGHIRARGPGAWELKYDAGVDPATKRRIIKYKTVRGTKRDAQREQRAIQTALDMGTYVDPTKLTVAVWLAQWLVEAKNSVAPKTLQRYQEIVDLHLTPALGSIALAKLAPVHIQKHYADAIAAGRRDGSGCPSSPGAERCPETGAGTSPDPCKSGGRCEATAGRTAGD